MRFDWEGNIYKNYNDRRSKITLYDSGTNKYEADNRDKKFVTVYRFDNGIIRQEMRLGKMCDYVMRMVDDRKFYFIELKGSDVDNAYKQIDNSIRVSMPDLHEMGMSELHGRIACRSRSGISSKQLHDLKNKFNRDFGGSLKVKSNVLSEVI